MHRLKYGYQWQNGQIVINEVEAQVVKAIFHGFINGQARYRLARKFKLHHTTVTLILTCPKYKGSKHYPAIISQEVFSKAQRILKRVVKRNPHHTKLPATKFYRGILQQKSTDPFIQAEFIYSLIHTEEEVYG